MIFTLRHKYDLSATMGENPAYTLATVLQRLHGWTIDIIPEQGKAANKTAQFEVNDSAYKTTTIVVDSVSIILPKLSTDQLTKLPIWLALARKRNAITKVKKGWLELPAVEQSDERES